jgi:hypothetical protein
MTQDEMIELAKQANFEWLIPDVKTLILLVAAKEREACAKVCDDIHDEHEAKDVFSSYAEAIRARGEQV